MQTIMWYLEDIRVTYTCRYDFLYANMFLIQTMAVRNFDFQINLLMLKERSEVNMIF